MDDSIIYGFYNLPSKIKLAKERLESFELGFWEQSFINCPLAFDDNGNRVTHKPFYLQINDLLDCEDEANQIVSFLEFKLKEFNRYLTSVSNDDELALAKKYRHHKSIPINELLINETVDECNQIEEASGYRYGFETDKAININDDYQHNLDNILTLLN